MEGERPPHTEASGQEAGFTAEPNRRGEGWTAAQGHAGNGLVGMEEEMQELERMVARLGGMPFAVMAC
jgi:hypothetical protein